MSEKALRGALETIANLARPDAANADERSIYTIACAALDGEMDDDNEDHL